jgi:hypothetical protein
MLGDLELLNGGKGMLEWCGLEVEPVRKLLIMNSLCFSLRHGICVARTRAHVPIALPSSFGAVACKPRHTSCHPSRALVAAEESARRLSDTKAL